MSTPKPLNKQTEYQVDLWFFKRKILKAISPSDTTTKGGKVLNFLIIIALAMTTLTEIYFVVGAGLCLRDGQYFEVSTFLQHCRLRLAQLPAIIIVGLTAAPGQAYAGVVLMELAALGQAVLAPQLWARQSVDYDSTRLLYAIILSAATIIMAYSLVMYSPYDHI